MRTQKILLVACLVSLGVLAFAPMFQSFSSAFFCKEGDSNGNCITIWNGAGIAVYANQGGALRFSVNGDSGDVNTNGTFSIRGTPIAYSTALPTPTPLVVGGVITVTVVRASTFVANGTPVIPFSTPQPTPTADGTKLDKSGGTITGALVVTDTLDVTGVITATAVLINATPVTWATPQPTYAYTEPTAVATATPQIGGSLYEVCGTDTITGTGTIAHGLATPSYITAGLAADATGDGVRVTWTNMTATVTLKVWNSALTPVAATTPVAVDWCAKGTK